MECNACWHQAYCKSTGFCYYTESEIDIQMIKKAEVSK